MVMIAVNNKGWKDEEEQYLMLMEHLFSPQYTYLSEDGRDQRRETLRLGLSFHRIARL